MLGNIILKNILLFLDFRIPASGNVIFIFGYLGKHAGLGSLTRDRTHGPSIGRAES